MRMRCDSGQEKYTLGFSFEGLHYICMSFIAGAIRGTRETECLKRNLFFFLGTAVSTKLTTPFRSTESFCARPHSTSNTQVSKFRQGDAIFILVIFHLDPLHSCPRYCVFMPLQKESFIHAVRENEWAQRSTSYTPQRRGAMIIVIFIVAKLHPRLIFDGGRITLAARIVTAMTNIKPPLALLFVGTRRGGVVDVLAVA